jgi:hypothetical protein
LRLLLRLHLARLKGNPDGAQEQMRGLKRDVRAFSALEFREKSNADPTLSRQSSSTEALLGSRFSESGAHA